MAQGLLLKTDVKPNIINREALIGACLGLLLPIPVSGGDWVSALCGALLGAIVGGFIGMQRMKKEQRDGKWVDQPVFWNKDTFIGGLFGNYAGGVLGMTAAMAIAVAGLASAGVDISASALLANNDVSQQMANLLVEHAPVYAVATTGVFLASWGGGTVVGSYVGGKAGEKRLTADYELARQQQVALQQGRSQQIAQSVEYTTEQPTKAWGKSVQEDKSRNAGQDKTLT